MRRVPAPAPTWVLTASLLAACAADSPAPTEVGWGGYLYADPYVSDDLLTQGGLDALDLDGECLTLGDACVVAEPSTDTEGYWSMTVPVATPAALRISGPGLAPMVWRATTPRRSAQWFTGGLFGRDAAALDAFAEGLALPGGPPTSVSDGSVAWMWGAPLSPDDWAGATLRVTDGDGIEHPVYAFTATDSGAYAQASGGPVDLFVAFDLAPGQVLLEVTAEDGRELSEAWPLRGGDVASAVFLALPTETP